MDRKSYIDKEFRQFEKSLPDLSSLYENLKDMYLKAKYGNAMMREEIRKLKKENIELKEENSTGTRVANQYVRWRPGDEKL